MSKTSKCSRLRSKYFVLNQKNEKEKLNLVSVEAHAHGSSELLGHHLHRLSSELSSAYLFNIYIYIAFLRTTGFRMWSCYCQIQFRTILDKFIKTKHLWKKNNQKNHNYYEFFLKNSAASIFHKWKIINLFS